MRINKPAMPRIDKEAMREFKKLSKKEQRRINKLKRSERHIRALFMIKNTIPGKSSGKKISIDLAFTTVPFKNIHSPGIFQTTEASRPAY